MMVLMALSSIAVEQTKAMEQTVSHCRQLLDYLSGHSDAKIRFHASDIILNINLDASYLSKTNTPSHRCGHYFMGWMPTDGSLICLNRAFHFSTPILKFVIASATKAKLGVLYHNCQTGILFWLTLTNMSHPQPKTPVHCNNATAVGIAINTIKRQRS